MTQDATTQDATTQPTDLAVAAMSGPHRRALARAVRVLERPNFAARIADYAGAPVNRVLRMMPRTASVGLSRTVERAIHGALETAIGSLDRDARTPPARMLSSVFAGFAGGISGFVGVAALPIELPLTTTMMLRAIADIARHNGEDLGSVEARLACLQVFALGARPTGARTDVGYFAARTMLSRLTGNAAAMLVERGAAELTAPMANRFVAEIVSRFSIVVSDRVAASAVPVVGAIGGATINVIFMNHFQAIAEGHFTVRRLERRYGADVVRRHYADLVAGLDDRSFEDRSVEDRSVEGRSAPNQSPRGRRPQGRR